MKKSLVLLPLIGGFVLAGCTFTIGNKTFKLFEKNNEQSQEQGKGSGNNSSGGNGGSQSGGDNGGSSLGTPLATVTLTGLADAVDTSARPLVFSKSGFSVEVAQGSASTDMAQAIANTKTYEFRVYKGMNLEFKGSQSFSKLLVKYSTYQEKSGTTYYFDFDLEGATNEHDDTKGEAVITLSSSASSFSVEGVGHQTRIASVAFYA